jgi:L-lactate dehydrogenase
MHKRTVFIVGGGGMVGATTAQVLAVKEIVSDIALIDIDEQVVRGQVMDINHAAAYTKSVHVRMGDYNEIKEDDIVVITSGAALQPGQTRLELLAVNAKITEQVVRNVMRQGKPVFLVMVTNPVDALTYVALKASGLPKERVFGTGTTLDSARLQVVLAHRLHVSQQEVQAYVLGEHGDSSFPALSSACIGGIPLARFPGFQPGMTAGIDQEIRHAAYEIVQAKRTRYGVGHAVAKIVEALLHDAASIYPVCSLAEGEYGLHDIVLGLPSLVSSQGARIIAHYPLSENEHEQLQNSAKIISGALEKISQAIVLPV